MMVPRMDRRILSAALLVCLCVGASPRAQADPHALLDRILDVYVRDGFVYYAALKTERANLDRYIATLDDAQAWLGQANDADRRAFWINAYNALVLRTVINAYPIRGRAEAYPANSIGQIPGAFAGVKHRVAGQVLTLDEIEKTVIGGFGDTRLLLALGRGTSGSPRLRSEVYRGSRLNAQLDEAVQEFVVREAAFRIDRLSNQVTVSPLFSWREDFFVAGFAGAGQMWANRSPLERAVVAMSYPLLFPSEREFLALNTFQMKFGEYDWSLNDLTGRGGE
jgi:hypothetical protein